MTHPPPSDEIAESSRALLSDLEASLADSQQALLARDFTGLEQRTREQAGACRALATLWPHATSDRASGAALRAAQMMQTVIAMKTS